MGRAYKAEKSEKYYAVEKNLKFHLHFLLLKIKILFGFEDWYITK